MLPHANARGLDVIRLVAPTTDEQRLPLVLDGSSGFVYYVSITGITGTRTASADELADAIPRIRKVTEPADRHRLRRAHARRRPPPPCASRMPRWSPPRCIDTLASEPGRAAAAPAPTPSAACSTRCAARRSGAHRPRERRDAMSWLTEFVRPKIRTLLGRREVPENLWLQCPACQQMIFHTELEKNRKICTNCGHHMRATVAERLTWTFDDGKCTRIELPKVPRRSAALPRQQALHRPPERGARQDPARGRHRGRARQHRRPAQRGRGDGVRLHRRLDGRRGRRRHRCPPRNWRCCRRRR